MYYFDEIVLKHIKDLDYICRIGGEKVTDFSLKITNENTEDKTRMDRD